MRKAIIILVLSLSFVFIGCNNKEEPYSDQEEKYNIDFINSCNLININVENISYYQKSQNWVGGERYSFSYKHKDYPIETFYVYYNLDGKVYSINYGDIKLYEINKTPWNVENYLVSYDMEIDLSIWAEDTINKILLFPLTASYSTYDWLYKRYGDIYTAFNYVEYENAFGVEIKSSFYLEFRVSTKGKLLYGVFNNTVIYGENSQIKEEYREIINPETEDDQSDYIYIKYDNIGKYGKSETYDGYTSIYYYIPVGTYNVEGLLKESKIYICNNEMIKVDGYWEDDVVKTVSFKSQNEIHEITIGKNQRLLITMYAEFKLYESDIKETINQYTITFNSNEGSSVTEITQDYNTIVLEPEEPVKEGYTFGGWYTDAELTEEYTLTTMPAENLTLYAKWISSYEFFTIDNMTYIYYGTYPQTVVDDSALIASLNTLTSTNTNGYYEYQGEEYAMVATPYSSGYKFMNGAAITLGQTYYFKVEPIKWRVLEEVDGTYTLLSEYIIDQQVFYISSSTRTIDGKTIYPNNYEHSTIREWLNNDFYNQAFSTPEKDGILTTLVDNSASTTGSPTNTNPYFSNNTLDKVYLLSYQEAISSTYGFDTNSTRIAITTDYARARGAYRSSLSSYYGNGYWWLRSPYFSDSIDAYCVYSDVSIYSINIVYIYSFGYGARPAIKIG